MYMLPLTATLTVCSSSIINEILYVHMLGSRTKWRKTNGEICFSSPFCLFRNIFENTFRHFGRHKSHKWQAIFYGHVDPQDTFLCPGLRCLTTINDVCVANFKLTSSFQA